MIWKKGWWETRVPFLFGLASMLVAYGAAYGLTFWGGDYDAANWASGLQSSANLTESERQALNNYQGQAWAIWIKLGLSFVWAEFAVLLGSFCLLTACPWPSSPPASRLFTFSLPVSRRKVLLSHATVGFGQMFLFGLLSPLVLPIISHFHGQWFSWSDALIYGLLMISGGAVLFSIAFLMTVILGNWFVVLVTGQLVVFALLLNSMPFGTRPWWNILGVMAGESYFYHGRIPWLGLLISLTLSAVFMYAAIRIYERRDF